MFNACAKYRRIKLLSEDGRASQRQEAFLSRHEQACDKCQTDHAVTMAAMAALRAAAFEPAPDLGFESRFIRRWRVEQRARAVSYWMPAVAGAVVASVAMMAVLQILFAAPRANDVNLKDREAQLSTERQLDIPDFGDSLSADPTQ